VVHVDGIFDGLQRQATETAGRHAGYVALCHRLTLESDAGNTPSGQEIEGPAAVACMRSVCHIRFGGARSIVLFCHKNSPNILKLKKSLMATSTA
jgi:hypothetical protein